MATGRPTYLVPVDGSARADIALLHAIGAARRDGAQVVALGITWVSPALPLDDALDELRDPVRAVLQRARMLAWQYHCPFQTHHVCTRRPAWAVVREAIEIGASAIFLPKETSIPRWLMPFFARFTWTITRHAPCPVFHDAASAFAPDSIQDRLAS